MTRPRLPAIHVHRLSSDPRKGVIVAGALTLPCALGRGGISRSKREGDGATPAGRLRALAVRYRPDRVGRPTTVLPLGVIRPADGWCDDQRHRRYNRPVPLPFPAGHERLHRDDAVYDVVVILDWNMRPAIRGRGSAIFLHLARPGYTPDRRLHCGLTGRHAPSSPPSRASHADRGRLSPFRGPVMTLSPGLLFDLDGTLVETDPTHLAAFNDILAANGQPTVDQHYYNTHIIGFQNAEIFARLFPALAESDHRRLADEKEALFRSRAAGLHPAKGLFALLDWADAHGVAVGVVTNAPRANAALMLGALGLTDRFRHVVIGDEMEFPKPHPLPYLTGAQRLGVDVAASVAFEDSRSGIRAAVAAGLTTVGMATSLSPVALREAGAHLGGSGFRRSGPSGARSANHRSRLSHINQRL